MIGVKLGNAQTTISKSRFYFATRGERPIENECYPRQIWRLLFKAFSATRDTQTRRVGLFLELGRQQSAHILDTGISQYRDNNHEGKNTAEGRGDYKTGSTRKQ